MIPTPARPDVASGAEPESEARRRHPILVTLVVASYAGVVLLRPGLPQNLAYIDPVIGLVCFVALLSMRHRGSPATQAGARALPWIWLVLLGSFIGLSTVGIPFWASTNMARTGFALLTFFCFWHIVFALRLERPALLGTAMGLAFTSVALLVQTFKYRGQAYFDHPNYAGHYCVLASAILIMACRQWWIRALALTALGIALWQTSSFGAIAMVVAMLAVLAFRSLKRSSAVLALALIVLVLGALFLASPGADSIGGDGWTVNTTLSSDRFDKSQGSRLQLWGQALTAFAASPWGVGPDGVHQRGIGEYNGHELEIHNDALGYLVERGVIGLIGFLGLWAVIWRYSKRGGMARVIIVAALTAGFFRETMHYRHMWLILALAFVLDARRTEADEAEALLADQARLDEARASAQFN